MTRNSAQNTTAHQSKATRHSLAHQLIDGFVSAVRHSHEMQQMLNQYR